MPKWLVIAAMTFVLIYGSVKGIEVRARLSEILFYLMDKGKFRRLGETEAQRESHLMIIAATTEDPRSSLLLTFRRRIPMMIEIHP